MSLPFLLLVSPPRLARPRRLALFRAGKRGGRTPARALPPDGRGGLSHPRPQRLALFLAGKRGGRTPALALLPDGRARRFPSFKRRRLVRYGGLSRPGPTPRPFRDRERRGHAPALALLPDGRGGLSHPRPQRPALFGEPGGRSQAPARALPPDGRAKRFPSFKRRRLVRYGAFPAPGPTALPFFWLGNEGAERLLWLCFPMGGQEAFHLSKGVAPLGVGGPFPPRPDALPFSGPGTKGPNARTRFASRRARGGLSLPGPTALPFFWLGNEGAERLPWLCFPRGGRNAFRLSKGVASLGVGGSFPAPARRLALFGTGNEGAERLHGLCFPRGGRELSIFQKVSPRWTRGVLSRPAPTPRPFRGPGTKEPNARPRLSRPDAPPFTGPGERRSRTSGRAGLRPRGAGAPAGRAGCTPPSRRCRPAGRRG